MVNLLIEDFRVCKGTMFLTRRLYVSYFLYLYHADQCCRNNVFPLQTCFFDDFYQLQRTSIQRVIQSEHMFTLKNAYMHGPNWRFARVIKKDNIDANIVTCASVYKFFYEIRC